MAAAHPDLAGEPLRVLQAGWDCLAVQAGARAILRVPRDAEAEATLRREARLLNAISPRVRLPVPRLALHEAPRLHSRHVAIPGEHLLPTGYAGLDERARDALAEALAGFFADLHAIPRAVTDAAGALPLEPCLPSDAILARALPRLPEGLRASAEATVRAWAALGPDPLGEGFGHFDAHGWNMAFDHAAGRLNGIYDFGDAGIGPRHGEFVAPHLVGRDLVRRLLPRYERITGRLVDRDRVRVLTGAHRLWELAVEAGNPATEPLMLAGVLDWFGARA